MLHNRIITPNKQEYLSLKNVKYRKILENTRKLSRLICIFMPAVGRSLGPSQANGLFNGKIGT